MADGEYFIPEGPDPLEGFELFDWEATEPLCANFAPIAVYEAPDDLVIIRQMDSLGNEFDDAVIVDDVILPDLIDRLQRIRARRASEASSGPRQ